MTRRRRRASWRLLVPLVGTRLDKVVDPSVLAVPLTDEHGHTTSLKALAGTQGTPVVGGEKLPSTMRTFLDDEGRADLASPAGPTWTSGDVLAAVSAVTGRPIH